MIVDREHQLAIFRRSLTDCEAGSSGSLVLTGPLASGKTALLRSFAAEAVERKFVCLTASGSRAERNLPLSVISQLCHSAPPTPAFLAGMDALREFQIALSATPGTPDPCSASVMHSLYEGLLELSSRTPVLISIDDLHHVDPSSLHCLVYLGRRTSSSRILVVAAGGDLVQPTETTFYTELLDHATGGRLRLAPLSRGGVSDLLAEQFGHPPSPVVLTACHSTSRGNPLLVGALAQDLSTLRDQDQLDANGQVQAGPAFRQAILRCLYRCEPQTQRILRARALLDEALLTGIVPPAVIGQLADVDPAVIQRTLSELDATGLLTHPLAKTAILETLSPADLATKRLLAAQLLRQEGLPALVIARLLLAAGRPVDGWAIPVLRGAASRLLDDGDTAFAIALLQLAHSSSIDHAERAALKALLFRAEWRTEPAAAVHRLPDLTDALDNGLLTAADSLVTVNHLLWFGQPQEAQRALVRMATTTAHQAQGDLRLATAWAAHCYPGIIGPADRDLEGLNRSIHPTTNNRDVLADVLEVVLCKGGSNQALTTAEQTLQGARLDDGTLIPISAALTALIYTDQLETAALWCGRLLGQATERQAPGWQATFAGLAATVALRQGKLAEVETLARTALRYRSARGNDNPGGAPVATLLRALTSMGRLAEAGQLLEWPQPDNLHQSLTGLAQLQARGHYYLAIDRTDAALDDFLTCGALMTAWNVDLPALVPWRLDAAQAHLRRGENEPAQALIDAQLAHPGTISDKVRGRALHLLAIGNGLPNRAATLRDAVELLLASGDRLELAHTLADLGHAYRALGDSQRARIAVRRAWQVAQECHAYALSQSLPDFGRDTTETPSETVSEALSAAERRVAALASEGRTNHQIARKLFITESTVEQHLTRVYRKLKVKRRADLPACYPMLQESNEPV